MMKNCIRFWRDFKRDPKVWPGACSANTLTLSSYTPHNFHAILSCYELNNEEKLRRWFQESSMSFVLDLQCLLNPFLDEIKESKVNMLQETRL